MLPRPGHHVDFFKKYLTEPTVVGAVAPSSPSLARALCDPFRRCTRPARVLEVGAGTGAITRHLGSLLGERDELDICEIHDDFADMLETRILTTAPFRPAVDEGRVRLLRGAVQDIARENHYDFVISGLPLTAFAYGDVRAVFATIRRSLKPGGILSYFEYVALRRMSRILSMGADRTRVRRVSAYLTRQIRRFQVDRRTVVANFPPAYARHLCFETLP